LPGWHEIEVSVDRQVGGAADPFSAGIIYATKKFDYYTLGFCSLPGHKYLVKSSFWKKKDARVTVVDTRSGEIVASQSRKVWYWHKPDVSIEQLKQDSSECKAKGDEKSCMEEKGYSWTKF